MSLKYEQLAISAEVFANPFSNYIIGLVIPAYSNMTIGADGVKQFDNIPGALLTVGEVSLKWQPIQRLSLQSVNSYTYGVDNDGGYLPYIPPFKSVKIGRASCRESV